MLPQVFLCKVCLWCKQEQAHVPEEPLQRARVCSKRGLCTWRGSWVGESGSIYCSYARGINPLCSCSPGVGILTPALAPSQAIPTSPAVLNPAALFGNMVWALLPTMARAGAAHCGVVVPSGSPQPQPLGKQHIPLGTFMASADASELLAGLKPRQCGRGVSSGWSHPGTVLLTEPGQGGAEGMESPAPGRDAPWLHIPAPSHFPGLTDNTSQQHPDPMGLGTVGKPLTLGDPAGDALKPPRYIQGVAGTAHVPTLVPRVHG